MHPLHNIHKLLIFRLTMFLAVGIFLSDKFLKEYDFITYHFLILLFLFLALLFLNKKRYTSFHNIFGIITAICFIIIGSLITQLKWNNTIVEWKNGIELYKGVIEESPFIKGRVNNLKVKCNKGIVNLSIINDNSSQKLTRGDKIIFYGIVKKPQNYGNPYEFDYSSYQLYHGYSGVSTIYSHYWKEVAHNNSFDIKQKALDCRDKIMHIYKKWGVEDDVLSLVSALTIGEKRMLSKEMKESYSDAGISHILSLSGMHTAIVWGILSLLLSFLDKKKNLRIIKWIIITLLLWSFAFITGLSPTIVRAVIMCMFVGMLSFSKERRNSLNVICVAAFLMLLYNPFYLFDVGFQLSFVAVFSIILFYEKIASSINVKNKILKKLWAIISISLSAQIGTAPLVVYYFSNFSIYFLLSNIIASILTPFIIGGIIAYFFLLPSQALSSFILLFIKYCVKALNYSATMISELPGSIIHLYDLSQLDVVVLYIIILLTLIYVVKRRRIYLINLSLLFAILFLAKSLSLYYKDSIKPQAIVYNCYGSKGIHVIENDTCSYIVSRKNDSLSNMFNNTVDRFCKLKKITFPTRVNDYSDNSIYIKRGLIQWHNKRFCIVDDNSWSRTNSQKIISIDYLFLTKGFTKPIKSLFPLFVIKNVILDASLSDYMQSKYEQECRSLNIKYINVKKEGYCRILL